jgi:hypothetical protein
MQDMIQSLDKLEVQFAPEGFEEQS